MFEHTPSPPLLTKRGPTQGAIYLQGFADGYYGRPRIIHRTRKAQEAYTKGYEAGRAQAQAKQIGTC